MFLVIKKKDKGRSRIPKNMNSGSLGKVKVSLHAKVEPNAWIINFGCSNNMMGDKGKFINFEKYDGGSVKLSR